MLKKSVSQKSLNLIKENYNKLRCISSAVKIKASVVLSWNQTCITIQVTDDLSTMRRCSLEDV